MEGPTDLPLKDEASQLRKMQEGESSNVKESVKKAILRPDGSAIEGGSANQMISPSISDVV
ncbi:OLC1v1012790C1 [Oldenlandia corymbosa var. corymbosa]|uniref:OLC1v1012790C1 n=1 Tax=Oldenlandia corymbosa var. corymbosa TaxID=529605 RepID=A0AAV1DWT4_OLDCO|nr:OLC1v1012790C1 [Oldenlandia corymbosa var. corymbosa]